MGNEIVEKAKIVEKMINERLGYEMPKSILFSITEHEEGVSVTETSTNGDVYDLLDSDDSKVIARISDYVAVVTTGWASPIDSDGEVSTPPSKHPERRRVRLMVFASREGVASVLRFRDEPDEIVVDEGQATGSLADAVNSLFV
jgi:hypothetical protein